MAQAVQIDWNELENSPEWTALTAQQKTWILSFLVSGNALVATRTAYRAKSEQNARILSYELKRNPTIVAALGIAAGNASLPKLKRDPERTKLLAANKKLVTETKKQLDAADLGSIAAQRLTSQLGTLLEQQERLTLDVEPETEPEAAPSVQHKFSVGQRVTQRGDDGILHIGQVLAVDAAGRATEIKEIHCEGR